MITDNDVTASILAYRGARSPCDENRCVPAAGMRATAEEIARRERVRIVARLRQWAEEFAEVDEPIHAHALDEAADQIEWVKP